MSYSVKWKNPATGAMRQSSGISFEKWENTVSRGVQHITGIPLDCGEDVGTADWYEDDITVNRAIQLVLDEWGFSDFEF